MRPRDRRPRRGGAAGGKGEGREQPGGELGKRERGRAPAERGGATGLPSGSPRLGLGWPLVGLVSERFVQRFEWREDRMKRRVKRKEART